MMGYIVLGIGFGILFEKNGYGLGWTLAMSIFVFAGSMQYVGIGLITGGVSLISTALTTLMVNARHLFYGVSMISKHKGAEGKPRLFSLHVRAINGKINCLNISDRRI
ncbi:MAG: AzlC family ABC transporter permease [Firmicutes bacterium]|nr:AzlC family ABC transporter permease [Bacillota bacterium]